LQQFENRAVVDIGWLVIGDADLAAGRPRQGLPPCRAGQMHESAKYKDKESGRCDAVHSASCRPSKELSACFHELRPEWPRCTPPYDDSNFRQTPLPESCWCRGRYPAGYRLRRKMR